MVGDPGEWEGWMRSRGPQGGPAGAVRVYEASCASTFRELDDAFLQKQTKIWLGEVLHLWFDETVSVADLLADGELLYQVSKVIWKMLLNKNREQLKQSKVYIYERLSFGRSNGKYIPYSKVDSFLKICQILGVAGIDLFTPSDVVEKRNIRKVCICIRSVSKKSQMMGLNVPDFDIATYTISMPNYIVESIRRSLEQPQYSSSVSSGYSPPDSFKTLQQQIIIFGGQNDKHWDTNHDSDEAESKLSLLEPEDYEFSDRYEMEGSQPGKKYVDLDDIVKPPPQRPEDDAPKSRRGVLRSVAGGITFVGAVFSMVHLRRGRGTGRQRRSRGRRAPEQEGAAVMQRLAGSMAWELAGEGVGLPMAVGSGVIWLFFVSFQLF